MSHNILAISGNDIFSGGGLHADLTTFALNGLHGFLALSCLTVLTDKGFEVLPIDARQVKQQLDSLDEVSFQAIKIGLLPTVEVAKEVLAFIKNRTTTPVVLDPVLVCKEKHDLEVSQLRDELIKFFPFVTIITPNLVEAQLLTGMSITNLEDMKAACQRLHDLGAKEVVIKGGNRLDKETAIDVYYNGQTFDILESAVVDKNNIGAGCTFASSIATYLALGDGSLDAIKKAKVFVREAIEHSDEYGVVQYH
ncbi:bifunctional hydroxymethylpyrimidine kinase/phosphomethylpyrimidine kinase [Streptococcus sp. zg-JUN1979]|uniref:bifunctional hydroxymethylpyrimidine kinase/phosphomethylpyrimidine kinase n=1 Tax=Streptococcus sp. zg-JUN1979 TaxID=3391450 RepID=UPI0039A5BE36